MKRSRTSTCGNRRDLESTYVLVPIKPLAESKTRLAPFFDKEERASLVRCLIQDFATEISQSKYVEQTLICTRDPKVRSLAEKAGFHCVPENEKAQGLDEIIDDLISVAVARGAKIAVDTSIDLPLFCAAALDRMIEMSEPQSVVFTIWRNGGVSTLLRRPPNIIPTAHKAEEPQLLAVFQAGRPKANHKYCDSFALSFDIDDPSDLIQCFTFLSVLKRRSRTFKFLRRYITRTRRKNADLFLFTPGPNFIRKLGLVDIETMTLTVVADPSAVSRLALSLQTAGIFRNPILFDGKRNFVIDGAHRLEAARALGCQIVPVQFVDYDDPFVKAKKWIRAIRRITRLCQLEKILVANGLEFEEVPEPESTDKYTYIVYRDRALRLLEDTNDTWERMETLSNIERALQADGLVLCLETDLDAQINLARQECDALLVPFSVSKELTIQAALSGKPFATAENRSVIPGRILHVDIPLPLLKTRIAYDKARQTLESRLSNCWVSYRKPGSCVDLRRYEEGVFVFEDVG